MTDLERLQRLFAFAGAILEQIFPALDPHEDPNPLLLLLLDDAREPVCVQLPPVIIGAKDRYALYLAALVQAVRPLAFGTALPAWDRSADPNREIIAVALQAPSMASMGAFDVARRTGAAPLLSSPQPPHPDDEMSGRFADLLDLDVSGLPEHFLDSIRELAEKIRGQGSSAGRMH